MAQSLTYLQVPKPSQPPSQLSSVEEDEDEEPYQVHLIPRSSPTPRKKSFWEKRDEEERPCGSPVKGSKVRFADHLGSQLVQVRFFEKFEVPECPGAGQADLPGPGALEFLAVPEFEPPAGVSRLLERVREQMVEVETVEAVEGDPLSFQGLVRVLNLAFVKCVQLRASLDNWATYYDYPTEYVSRRQDSPSHTDSPTDSPSLTDSGTHTDSHTDTDRFHYRLSFVPPFLQDGARFEFVARYQTPQGVYWANNGGRNYAVSLRAVLRERETQDTHSQLSASGSEPSSAAACQRQPKPLKSCLKPARVRSVSEESEFHHLNPEHGDSKEWTKKVNGQTSRCEADDWRAQAPEQVVRLLPPISLTLVGGTFDSQEEKGNRGEKENEVEEVEEREREKADEEEEGGCREIEAVGPAFEVGDRVMGGQGEEKQLPTQPEAIPLSLDPTDESCVSPPPSPAPDTQPASRTITLIASLGEAFESSPESGRGGGETAESWGELPITSRPSSSSADGDDGRHPRTEGEASAEPGGGHRVEDAAPGPGSLPEFQGTERDSPVGERAEGQGDTRASASCTPPPQTPGAQDFEPAMFVLGTLKCAFQITFLSVALATALINCSLILCCAVGLAFTFLQ